MKFVVMTFQVVTDDDVVCMEQSHRIPVEPCKHEPNRIIPSLADHKAAKFLDDAVHKGVLSEPAHRKSVASEHRKDFGIHHPRGRLNRRVDVSAT